MAIALGVALGAGAGPGVVVGGALAGPSGSSGAGGSFGDGRAQGGENTAARGKARDRSTARTTARLVRKGLRLRDRGVDADSDCVAHSYGQVQDFFRAHPCKALFRALRDVRDNRGNLAVLAIAWVDMPNAEQAQQLKQLLDRPGTGNITELSRQRGGQRFSGTCYRSVRDDNTVVNVQAEPVGRARTAIELAKLTVNTAI
ncbi:MAG: hypothetical protein J2P20_15240 [Pseudonocardia sp.]|nr:hypothetical protein [Pseudonocardia sp.]MBO0877980.1 hypothetical protein [Pseudonocardia sp.]